MVSTFGMSRHPHPKLCHLSQDLEKDWECHLQEFQDICSDVSKLSPVVIHDEVLEDNVFPERQATHQIHHGKLAVRKEVWYLIEKK